MIEEYLTEKYDVLRKQGVDKFNKPKYDYYDRNIPCRFEKVTRKSKNDKGEDIVCDGTLFTEADIKENDRIEIEGDTFVSVEVDELKDEDGSLTHREVKLKFIDA